jgi:pimeloyl-ACP methyl ester carboxylesterase
VDQEIRFCTSGDGVRLAYSLAGRGAPLVKTANWLNHLEFDWRSPVWRHVLEALARHFTLLRYDERGNGLSDWNVDDISFDAFVRDLEAVVDAAGLDRFALFGVSQGCPVSIAYAARHPERVTRLVLYGGYAKGWRRREPAEETEEREALKVLIRRGWGKENPAFRQVFTSLFFPDGTPAQMDAFNELQRVTASPENAIRLLDAFSEIDVTDLLPKVRAPTLVLHCRGDARIPFAAGRALATGIPGARFVPLEGRNHLILENEPAWPRFLEEVVTFLGASPETRGVAGDSFGWRATGSALDGPARASAARSATPPEELRAGTRIGPYEIVERLGRGGMGTVYRARHGALGRDVAVKALRALGPDADLARRFEREARMLAGLDHPNVATVHDYLVVEGKPYLILELVEGATLSDRIARGPLPPDEVRAIALALIEALAEAHGKGIVHRDLKPANIKITPRGRVKVLDFGLAKAVGGDRIDDVSFATASAVVLGTPSYMSPEQARGEAIDARTDIWAFGCVLFEMCAGAPAFGGDTLSDVIASVLRDEPDLGRLRADTPQPIARLIGQCLQKDPARRPQSIEEARVALGGSPPG